MWSIPLITPFAIDGAAPSTTTNKMARSVSLNSRIDSGNHAIDGIVCSPVMNEPTADRRMRDRATSAPTTTPITSDTANPTPARWPVMPSACHVVAFPNSCHRRGRTVPGPGST